MGALEQHRTQHLGRRALGALVLTTLIAALGAALTVTQLPSAPAAQAAGPIDAAAAAPVAPRTLVPPPPLPDRVIPDLPLPVPAAEEPEPAVAYTCDPSGDPEFGDPDNPNLITNKDCPEITAAKEQAQREYAEQLGSAQECIGYGCSPEQDAEINRQEREANAGESAGRLPTSGETQFEYGCAQGYIPADQC